MKNVSKNSIKEMENEKRQSKAIISTPEIVSFDAWWMVASKRLNLKGWLKEIIWADFKGRGLSEKETIQRYEEGLKLFGY
jgi:hypothetical protein